MEELLDAVAALAGLLSPEKVAAIAARIRGSDPARASIALFGVLGTRAAADVAGRLVEAWKGTAIKPDELALMLVSASRVAARVVGRQSVELVWTGPTTPFVSTRRTEQALLQVIGSARSTLFVTSFVAYDVSNIVAALNEASGRGVSISMLLESSREQGGSVTLDVIGKMRELVPKARLYGWLSKADEFSDGRVHAKVAVADGRVCFITSANLTRYAMERNMEAGVLVSGGEVPRMLDAHLSSLVTTDLVAPV